MPPFRRAASRMCAGSEGRQAAGQRPDRGTLRPRAPGGDSEVREKFHALADPSIGQSGALAIERIVAEIGTGTGLANLLSEMRCGTAKEDRVSEKT